MLTQAEKWLREILGGHAEFRDGQWEAIAALVEERQRVLVVQRTGWGKSLVYFMATRLLRERGAGPTILISPLLSLMRNQIASAQGYGLRAAAINSDNSDQHEAIGAALLGGRIDILLISPERLANDRFQRDVWAKLRHQVGLLVIDEAHCISDWGHDFRPNYRRIMGLLDEIPSATPVLGTTATANDRVVADVADIMGVGMNIQRGPLTRESLALYVYPDPMDAPSRLTLLSHLMRSIPGSGIIYCTTTRDCRRVAEWLQSEGHNVKAYYADVDSDGGEDRAEIERQLLDNELKALVASVALGMGFDKPDLHFVVHYQLPGNIISYYQQIGRAGRGIDKAHIILMHGPGDEDIQQYFINTAFPTPRQVSDVIAALNKHGDLTRAELQRYVNVRLSTLENILTHLEVEGIVTREGSDYCLVAGGRTPDYSRWDDVTRTRQSELAQMNAYVRESGCLMRFIAAALDDPQPVERCGRCKNCTGAQSKFKPDPQVNERARQFLCGNKPLTFQPRRRWPKGVPGIEKTTDLLANQPGLALAGYYDDGWGDLVRRGRLEGRYDDSLIEAAAQAIQTYFSSVGERPRLVVPVPSLRRPALVADYAQRLSAQLGWPLLHALKHNRQHPPQLEMRNSHQQAANVLGSFSVVTALRGEPLLLVDDVADSKWTLTVLGDLLQGYGAGRVYPFVLAVTNTSDD
jgi:ATP-dependent DNA helicase RecQ